MLAEGMDVPPFASRGYQPVQTYDNVAAVPFKHFLYTYKVNYLTSIAMILQTDIPFKLNTASIHIVLVPDKSLHSVPPQTDLRLI